jgi:hypothetical protein
MALHHNPKLPTENLVFLVDPANPKSFDPGTLAIRDIVGQKVMTTGADLQPGGNTPARSVYSNYRYFTNPYEFSANGSYDTGYRYGGSTDKVVDSADSWTVGVWIHKTTTANPGNWWHLITDGNSGDILTLNESGLYLTSMNNAGGGGSFTAGSDITYDISYSSVPLGWNLHTVVYDRPNNRVKLVINGTSSSWYTGRTINPDYRIRNFIGWGSAQSSYHSDPAHSVCFAYQRALSDSEIAKIYNTYRNRLEMSYYSEGADCTNFFPFWSNTNVSTMEQFGGLGQVTAHGFVSGPETYTLTLPALASHSQVRYRVYWHLVDSLDTETSYLYLGDGSTEAEVLRFTKIYNAAPNIVSTASGLTTSWSGHQTYSYRPWGGGTYGADGYLTIDSGWRDHTSRTFTARHVMGADQARADEAMYLSHVELQTR